MRWWWVMKELKGSHGKESDKQERRRDKEGPKSGGSCEEKLLKGFTVGR